MIILKLQKKKRMKEPETLDINTVMNAMITENGGIYRNSEQKFYSSIVPVQQAELKHSKYRKILGYVIIACGYDARNFFDTD